MEMILAAGKFDPVLPHVTTLLDQLGRSLDRCKAEVLPNRVDKLLFLKKDRNMVGRCDVVDRDDLRSVHGAHVRNLLNSAILERPLAATGDQVRVKTSTSNVADGSLRRLGLLLAVDHGHIGHMNLDEVSLARASLELTDSVNEGRALDISHCTTQLDDTHIGLGPGLVNRDLGNALDPFLDGVGDVRYDLNRLAEIVADTLSLDDRLVNLARRDVVIACEGCEEVALVVAEIEIHFAAVIRHVDLAVSRGSEISMRYESRKLRERHTHSIGDMVPASMLM